ncbi:MULTISPECIES: hypothetical protein [unclassified Pantoea]|uniref:hypothetical protein n=1 Tax=unclassified Pantoea TaxID=2630326 RepID=UPI001231C006|nr:MULTISPECIES: hypothetical protein [unclassified Pantoea]KAA5957683.1 hypothetical protein F3I53_15630 [Pantoea sp. VH_16]KAA6105008.1 hypothetical protein F3I25_15520 [Pantoea sp. Bo_14]KAA6108602.1 hypothetical protein F3I23_14375 [Pantoea sp. Bo_11]
MKKHAVSEEVQWEILDYLYDIHPQRLTESEFCENFGEPENAALIANVRILIDEGLVNPLAVIKTLTREVIFPSELRLTPAGLNLVSSIPEED